MLGSLRMRLVTRAATSGICANSTPMPQPGDDPVDEKVAEESHAAPLEDVDADVDGQQAVDGGGADPADVGTADADADAGVSGDGGGAEDGAEVGAPQEEAPAPVS